VRGARRDTRQDAGIPTPAGASTRSSASFDGGVDPTKGCFEKLENKSPNDCITSTTPGRPRPPRQLRRGVRRGHRPGGRSADEVRGRQRKKCVSKYLKALLKCHQLAQTLREAERPNAKQLRRQGAGEVQPAASIRRRAASTSSRTERERLRTPTATRRRCRGWSRLRRRSQPATHNTNVDQLDHPRHDEHHLDVDDQLDLDDLPTRPASHMGCSDGRPAGRFTTTCRSASAANNACSTNFACTHALHILVGVARPRRRRVSSSASRTRRTIPLPPLLGDRRVGASPAAVSGRRDGGSFLNWEYQTAHTASAAISSPHQPHGRPGTLQMGQQCNFTSKVGPPIPSSDTACRGGADPSIAQKVVTVIVSPCPWADELTRRLRGLQLRVCARMRAREIRAAGVVGRGKARPAGCS